MFQLVLLVLWFVVASADGYHNVLHVEEVLVPIPPPLHQEQFCYEHSCKDPTTLPITQFEAVEAGSPFYVSVLPLNHKTEHIDNACYSFFKTGGTTLLFYLSVVYKNGSSEQWSYSKDDVPGRLGVLRGGNPTCMFQESAIQMACQNTFILYRCFLYGCFTQLDAVNIPGVDLLLALSAEPKTSEECQDKHVTLMRNAGFNDRGYVKLPQNRPSQCVTSLSGSPSIGAEKVPPGNSISKP